MVKVNKKKSVNNNNIFKVELEQLRSADDLETTIYRGICRETRLIRPCDFCLLFLVWFLLVKFRQIRCSCIYMENKHKAQAAWYNVTKNKQCWISAVQAEFHTSYSFATRMIQLKKKEKKNVVCKLLLRERCKHREYSLKLIMKILLVHLHNLTSEKK